MSESVHRIRWKGRTEGPYSREEIRERLARGELSLLHRVEVSGNWIGLGEFLAPQKPAEAPRGAAPVAAGPVAAGPTRERTVHAPLHNSAGISRVREETEKILRGGYFLCGLCFVAPLAATVPAVAVAMRLRRRGEDRPGRVLLTLAALFTLLGFLFWLAVKSAYARGMI
jgi:hypothetical protein